MPSRGPASSKVSKQKRISRSGNFSAQEEFFFLRSIPDRKNNFIHNPEKVFKQAFEDCFSFKFEKGFFDHAHPSASAACQDDSASKFLFCLFQILFFYSFDRIRGFMILFVRKFLFFSFFPFQACFLSFSCHGPRILLFP